MLLLNPTNYLTLTLGNIFTNILLQVEKVVENPFEAILKYGGKASVVTILMAVIYLIIKHFMEVRKDAKDNEKVLEDRNIALQQEKTELHKAHIMSLKEENEKLILIIKENNTHHEKMLKDFMAEGEKNRMANAAEYDKQRAMYENMYTKLESKKG